MCPTKSGLICNNQDRKCRHSGQLWSAKRSRHWRHPLRRVRLPLQLPSRNAAIPEPGCGATSSTTKSKPTDGARGGGKQPESRAPGSKLTLAADGLQTSSGRGTFSLSMTGPDRNRKNIHTSLELIIAEPAQAWIPCISTLTDGATRGGTPRKPLPPSLRRLWTWKTTLSTWMTGSVARGA